ncbi:MAG: FHA domain-containing protein [Proteobacteria bacterium]|nr:FHA domain-containing protein [Pseudomonadota bacterium]
MGSIRHLSATRSYLLTSSYIVGRASGCGLQLASRLVSAEHAAFHWTDSGWTVRDLSSSNGTFVDGRRLEAGERMPLGVGARIAFGDPEDVFEMVEDGPPVALVQTPTGERIEAENGLLFLPNPDAPELILSEDVPGHWFAEAADGERRRVKSGQVIQCAGLSWHLTLPEVHNQTWRTDENRLLLRDIGLRFTVSRNEEYVTIAVVQGGQLVADLPHRAHSYLLLTLARARLADQEPDVPASECGWMYIDSITTMLKITASQLNVLIHRARAQLRRADIAGASDLVERRPSTQQVRLGVSRIELDC